MPFFSRIKRDWLKKLKGRDISGIVVFGDVHGNIIQGALERGDVPELSLGWQRLRAGQPELAWLEWRTRASPLLGRDKERDELLVWAQQDEPGVLARFVTGEGGVGKTRLAAEVAKRLGGKKHEWAAGFADLRKPEFYGTKKAGTLILVDYPEERREGVRGLLENLSRTECDEKIRLLFLSRRGWDHWEQDIVRAKAIACFDAPVMELAPLPPPSAYMVFRETQKKYAKIKKIEPRQATEAEFEEWLAREDTGAHNRPLFIAAAALYSVIEPETPVIRLAGKEIIHGLVQRELGRMADESRAAGLANDQCLSRLAAFAAVRDGLDTNAIRALAQRGLELGLPSPSRVVDGINKTGRLVDGRFPPPRPDIIGACLVVEVFKDNPDMAPEWLWAGIEDDVSAGLERLGRLSHDAEIVLGLHKHRLRDWLALVFTNEPERSHKAGPFVEDVRLPIGLVPAAVAIWQSLLNVTKGDAARAMLLNNLSVDLRQLGDGTGALAAGREAVDIYRRLAKANPARFEPNLAMSLNTLSNRLSEAGDGAGALAAIREAVEIRRRLAAANPARFEPDLALSLNNLSNSLSEAGDGAGALAAIREAVEIRRRLAAANPARFEPDLALSLNNLSNSLSEAGDGAGALAAIREAVEIYDRLAKASPARFEPDLATSFNNLSADLSAAGDGTGALAAIREAVKIYRRLAAASPARFEPELATGLNNLSADLSAAGDGAGALAAIREAVEIRRRLAAANPARFEPNLAMSLNTLSNRLGDAGDGAGALAAIREAVDIRRRLAAANPARFEPELALSLSVLSDRLEEQGQRNRAVTATEEALRLMQPYAERYPKSENARLYTIMKKDLARLTGEGG